MSSDNQKSDSEKGRRKKKASSQKVDSLYMKRQQLLREMQSSSDEKAISIREQLRTLEEAAKNNAPTEDDWGKATSRRKSSLWMLWAILGLAVPTALIGLALMASRMKERTGGTTYGAGGLDFDSLSIEVEEAPEDWFVENSIEATESGMEILETLSQENLTEEALVGIVRNDEQIQRILTSQREDDWPAFDLSEPTEITWKFGSVGRTGFMVLIGPRADYSVFRAYFVRSDRGLLFDLDATEGRSEIPIVELPAAALTAPSLTRAWVAKEPHFDARSDADLYSWYQLLTPNLIDFVWAYTEAGGELDEQLKTELNYGRLIGERKREFRATVIIHSSEIPEHQKDEFLLEELVTVDWVLPPEAESTN